MRQLGFVMAALAAMPVGSLLAQDVAGTWQGTINPGKEMRIVYKIERDGSNLKGAMYSIDEGGRVFPAAAVTLQGTTLKITVPSLGGTYEGKLAGDTITGTWTQGQAFPLSLTRATPTTAWAIPDPAPPAKTMAANANPSFDVATIKPSDPDQKGIGVTLRGREVVAFNTPLSFLLTLSYDLNPRQIQGLPEWASNDKWDITGLPDQDGLPSVSQLKIMMRKLLAERFGVEFHREKKEMSAYVLAPGKGDHKLTKSIAQNDIPGLGFRGLGAMVVRNATLGEFVSLLQGSVLDRPVVDQSGVNGRWDFTLDWTPDEFQFPGTVRPNGPPAKGDPAPDLFTAVQNQLGLKLESGKAQVEVLVIEKVHKPTAN